MESRERRRGIIDREESAENLNGNATVSGGQRPTGREPTGEKIRRQSEKPTATEPPPFALGRARVGGERSRAGGAVQIIIKPTHKVAATAARNANQSARAVRDVL